MAAPSVVAAPDSTTTTTSVGASAASISASSPTPSPSPSPSPYSSQRQPAAPAPPTGTQAKASEGSIVDERGPMPQCFSASSPSSSSSASSSSSSSCTGGGSKRRRILAYGDSLTAGFYNEGDNFAPYGQYLAQRLAQDHGLDVDVVVCGLSGLTAQHMAKGLPAKRMRDGCRRTGKGLQKILMEEDNFDLALIMAGTNDLSDRKVGPVAIAVSVQSLHTACHEFKVPTAILSIPLNDLMPGESAAEQEKSEISEKILKYRERWITTNALLKQWSQGAGKVDGVAFFVDTADLLPYSDPSPLWEEDGLHLSPKGSETLGSSLAPLIAKFFSNRPRSVEASVSKPLLRADSPMPETISPPEPLVSLSSAPRRLKILAYGDSLTAGYNCWGHLFTPYAEGMVSALLPTVEAEVCLCGLSGVRAEEMAEDLDAAKVSDCLHRTGKGLRHMLKDDGPFDVAVIMAGTNDLADDPEPGDLYQNILALHTACHKASVPSVVLSIPPSKASSRSARLRRPQEEVNAMLQKWATRNAASGEGSTGHVLAYIEIGELLPYSSESGHWELDGLHFSRAGCLKLGENLAKALLPQLSALAMKTPNTYK